tara:strand:+ start:2751 stop:5252 length:2502 start_codon:yes stop_codon:yes gene_type:complete
MLDKTIYKYIFIGFITAFVVVGCSRKKDKFLNKNFHSITTKYNYLYNGNNLLNEALESLNDQEKDNFWKLIPIEKYNSEIAEDNFEKNSQTPFSQAEEKAALAIQKHSMNINGKEANPIMDEAYILLGKARYYDQRFIPSLEAFNYILFKHPSSQYINHVKIWKEKINIRLGQNQRAIVNLKELINNNKLESQDLAQANLFLSQAYINTKSQDSAIACLKTARALINEKPIKARYNYILGQLYDYANYKDSANTLYNENIDYKRKIPREYTIHSHIRRTTNSDSINNSIIEIKELVDNIENTVFLGSLFHQLALLSLRQGKDSIAVKFFNNSLESIVNDDYLETENYQNLADINFENKEYLTAGLYYDSTLTKLERKTKLYRRIKKKRDNLQDLILYENITATNDSILSLINMDHKAREVYFKTYIEELKTIQAQLDEEEEKNNNFGSQNLLDQKNSSYDEAVFYFYNPTAVSYGKGAFSKKWGKRKLVNNWRWSIEFDDLKKENEEIANLEIPEDSLYNVDYYINRIPKSTKVIDSIKLVTNDAYYKLGAIYKDQFKEFKISNQKLTKLLNNKPEESLIPPAKYSIYKNHISLGDSEQAELIKDDIINNYPKSKYAEFLLNPEEAVVATENNPTAIYNTIYQEYSDQNYIKAIKLCDQKIKKLFDTPIISKIEMLKAVSIAKEYGYSQYKEQLNFIKLNYSNTIEGKEAEYILEEVLPLLSSKDFSANEISNNFKIIYEFTNPLKEEITNFITLINNAINEIEYLELKTSQDYYNNIVTFVVLHGLKSYDGAMGLAEMLDKAPAIQKNNSFVISSENYKTIQIHKNLEEYLK